MTDQIMEGRNLGRHKLNSGSCSFCMLIVVSCLVSSGHEDRTLDMI